jgi:preprotein translocase subunit SecE
MSETDQLRTNKKMGKTKGGFASPLVREMFQMSLYKRSQGRIARQVTFGAIVLLVAIGAWRTALYLRDSMSLNQSTVAATALGVGLVGAWIAFRLVNLPSFADFLIAVEAEMNKVSWPTRTELIRSSLVVIFSILFLATILFAYDLFWKALLELIGVVRTRG